MQDCVVAVAAVVALQLVARRRRGAQPPPRAPHLPPRTPRRSNPLTAVEADCHQPLHKNQLCINYKNTPAITSHFKICNEA